MTGQWSRPGDGQHRSLGELPTRFAGLPYRYDLALPLAKKVRHSLWQAGIGQEASGRSTPWNLRAPLEYADAG
jgi:hypothetical protein